MSEVFKTIGFFYLNTMHLQPDFNSVKGLAILISFGTTSSWQNWQFLIYFTYEKTNNKKSWFGKKCYLSFTRDMLTLNA